MDPKVSERDPRNYMAAERTFLAWLRTGIALMGFGFVVARFGLFLREMVVATPNLPHERVGFTLPAGIALIVFGMVINVVAGFRHSRYIQALDRGDFRSAFGSKFAYAVGGFLALIGLAMAVHLAKL